VEPLLDQVLTIHINVLFSICTVGSMFHFLTYSKANDLDLIIVYKSSIHVQHTFKTRIPFRLTNITACPGYKVVITDICVPDNAFLSLAC